MRRSAAWLVVPCCLALSGGATVGLAQEHGPPPVVGAETLGYPFGDYMRVGELWQAGKQDEAVYWFYRGQLRCRIYLLAHPDLKPDGDPALFASMNATVGEAVNEYAFGDIPALLATIDRVLAWHAANDDPFTPKARYPEAHAGGLAGLKRLREEIVAQQDEIRAERRAKGSPNRN